MEELITARLRKASETWVFATARAVFFFAVSTLIVVAHLLSERSKTESPTGLARYIAIVLLSLMLIAVTGLPLAQVAEVFEYDVLRALNTPLVVQRAQRHFGHQLLPHLHTLEWGFRLGGTVINMRMVVSLFFGSMLTVAASVSQSIVTYVVRED